MGLKIDLRNNTVVRLRGAGLDVHILSDSVAPVQDGPFHGLSLPKIILHFAKGSAVLCMAGIAYYILSRALIQLHGRSSTLATAVGKDKKGIISVVIYALTIPLSFINGYIGLALYALVAAIWLIPDQRIEKKLDTN